MVSETPSLLWRRRQQQLLLQSEWASALTTLGSATTAQSPDVRFQKPVGGNLHYARSCMTWAISIGVVVCETSLSPPAASSSETAHSEWFRLVVLALTLGALGCHTDYPGSSPPAGAPRLTTLSTLFCSIHYYRVSTC